LRPSEIVSGPPLVGQAITAAGTGCAAALDAERYIADLDHTAATTGEAQDAVAAEAVTETVQTAGL